MKTFNTFTFIGRSGSGKGTQINFLEKELSSLRHLYAGKIFRSITKKETEMSQKIKEIADRGELIPSFLAFSLWASEFSFVVKKGESVAFEGSPRTTEEAKWMKKFLSFLGRWERTVHIVIDISEEEARERILSRRVCEDCKKTLSVREKPIEKCPDCGGELIRRHDDEPEAIKRRMDFYKKDVVPAIKYLEENGNLININGEQSPQEVFAEIKKKLQSL